MFIRSSTPNPNLTKEYAVGVPAGSKAPVDYSYRKEAGYAKAAAKLRAMTEASIKAKACKY